MKAFAQLSQVFAVAGVLLAVYAVVGRFVGRPTLFGYLFSHGIEASSALTAANTLLILAVLTYLYKKQ
ncbi:MAG TPA: hypothetical protein VN604_04480 [Nitrospirota bacterium]|nr:hypothetical protein [Nitrospirota bacterium]